MSIYLNNYFLTLLCRLNPSHIWITRNSYQLANEPSCIVFRHSHYEDCFPTVLSLFSLCNPNPRPPGELKKNRGQKAEVQKL
ncbi:hypothetical protein N7501_003409 [Penicillium viridicatum]|nr:hypothetical protein N7501_003409 [Penicillium viridicatum]